LQTKRDFFNEAVKNLKSSGSILPSSKFLMKRMLESIDFKNTLTVVEFGPGNGIFTKEILKKLPANAQLICFEINDEFLKHLQNIKDDRLHVVSASAEDIIAQCHLLSIDNVDLIISSLPLTNIPNPVCKSILKNSYTILREKGSFLQYQYSLTYYKKLKAVFNDNVDLSFEIRNIPPAFIYKCNK
tara:strand:- start:103559 stop:104116 length:558 start_codon:yes stop_codon:yes gene_type:complete